MGIEELKKELGINDKDISKLFQFKNVFSYRNSSAKKRYEYALCNFYELIKK